MKLDDHLTYTCLPDTSIRAVMERMNVVVPPIMIVVDDARRPLGSVTNGDLRRALLRGASLDLPVSEAMNASMAVGRVGDVADAMLKLDGLRMRNPYAAVLPLVDDVGRMVELLMFAEDEPSPGVALVMAGGFGRRLGELTRTTPKPLLPVGGRPILDHILERLEDAGIARIYVSAHYLSDQIASFVAARDNRAVIELLHEDEPLGTAGAIGLLPEMPTGLLLLNGDVLTQMDVGAFVGFHRRHGYDATLAVAQHEVHIPFGVVRYSDDGLLLGIDEKPTIRNFVAAGIYYLSESVIPLVGEGRYTEMPDLLNTARKLGLKLGVFPIHEYWADVGRPGDLDKVQQDMKS